ncbi:MAG TPA: hypothetical protein VHR17_00585 [Thermoanaerobaculia bacterium]|nr:hypothetical protein [Thermoanaerobaculia bacterium]
MIAARSRHLAHAVWAAVALAAATTLAAPSPTDAPPPHLVLESIAVDGQPRLAFGVRDLPRDVVEQLARTHRSLQQWRALFSVHVENERATPILGDYRAVDGALWLVPSFPPERGVRYIAVFQPTVLQDDLQDETAAAADPAPDPVRAYLEVADLAAAPQPTLVSAVHPTTSEIPENLLRFYVHFTASMSRGDVLRWVRLEDSTGASIEQAFLALEEELWDPHATRLTLLLDPGRIKSGLRPRAELGRALAEGHRVTIAIDGRWPDASGRPLGEGFRRSFRVVAADQAPPDPARWRLEPPRAGGRDPLRITLGEPLDHALLQRLVWVEDEAGQPLAGSIAVGDDERSWIFTPRSPWSAGRYAVAIDRRLEDLAGNRIGRPFEVDLSGGSNEERATVAGEQVDHQPVRLPWNVVPDPAVGRR